MLEPTQACLLVLNKNEGSAHYLRADNGALAKSTPLAPNPHEVTISAGGRFAIVSCSLGQTCSSSTTPAAR